MLQLRDLVNKPSFILRKKLDMLLHRLFGHRWIPLYSMVTFSRIRYHKAVEKRQWQDAVSTL
jgi:kynurenine 3-monooxygenase